MIIDIKDSDKACITHALRVAMGRINSSLMVAFNNCHPDRQNLNWFERVEDDISVMKGLKQLIDRIESDMKREVTRDKFSLLETILRWKIKEHEYGP